MYVDNKDISLSGDEPIGQDLFGGNVLASRGELLGQGSYEDAVMSLGVTGLRYPGGALTEYLFDISDPDATSALDSRDGEIKSLIPLTDFMNYAEAAGQPVTIVIPTRTQLSVATDDNGDRHAEIDEESLREFVSSVVNGEYGGGQVQAFEIGNEYWGSGEMNAIEYGDLASAMTEIIHSELIDAGRTEIDIVVQKGNNFGFSRISESYEGVSSMEALADLNKTYDMNLGDTALFNSGDVNWAFVNSQLVMRGFDRDEEVEGLDGVVTHIYSRGEKAENTRFFDLDQANKTWIEEYPDLDIYITEWNLKSTPGLDRHEDYGLFQAHEMLEIMEEFVRTGVDTAHAWPLNENTRNALSQGFEFDEASAAGEMFALMSETLPGKVLIDLDAEGRDTEMQDGGTSVHMFAGEGELALYIVNSSEEEGFSSEVDVSEFIQNFETVDIVVLGVAEGERPGSNRSEAVVEELDPSLFVDGKVTASLDPGEIMQVVLSNVEPTVGFSDIWDAANSANPFDHVLEDSMVEPSDEPILPIAPVDDAGPVDAGEDDEEDASGTFGLEWLVGFVLLAGLGLGGLG